METAPSLCPQLSGTCQALQGSEPGDSRRWHLPPAPSLAGGEDVPGEETLSEEEGRHF